MTKVFTAEDVRRLSKEPDPLVDKWIEEQLVRFFRDAGKSYVYVLRHQALQSIPLRYLAKKLKRRGFEVSEILDKTQSTVLELKVSFPVVEE